MYQAEPIFDCTLQYLLHALVSTQRYNKEQDCTCCYLQDPGCPRLSAGLDSKAEAIFRGTRGHGSQRTKLRFCSAAAGCSCTSAELYHLKKGISVAGKASSDGPPYRGSHRALFHFARWTVLVSDRETRISNYPGKEDWVSYSRVYS